MNVRKAFTLIELVIVLAIFSVMTVLLFANSNRFGADTALTNSVYDTMLSIRQAQTYSVAVHSVDATSFRGAYGVHVDIDNPRRIILFADTSADGENYMVYNVDGDTIIRTDEIGKDLEISDLCGRGVDGNLLCGKGSLDIAFIRPRPTAYMSTGITKYTEARICFSSGATNRQIVVLASGQITIADGCGEV